ncbi:carbohydrate sulfotransferase 12-like [Xenentodon cancila]
MKRQDFHNVIVDDKHRILYCYIPKVACSNWKRVMFTLKNDKPYGDLSSIDREFVHTPNLFPLLSRFSMEGIEMRLTNYTKFLFVRDPFVRLISAYRDKFEKNNENEYFYNYTKHIMRLYGKKFNLPKTVGEAFASGVHPTFHDFIQYLLDPITQWHQPFEPHWRQMYRLCHPCSIQYDFIGHQETLTEDAEELLKILKLQDDIKLPPSYVNMTSTEFVMNWFKTIPLEERRKLYNIYEKDFQLFGYSRPDKLLMVEIHSRKNNNINISLFLSTITADVICSEMKL